eukprot:gene12041-5437_t
MFDFWKNIKDGFLGPSNVKYIQNLDSNPIFSAYLSPKKQILSVSSENLEIYDFKTEAKDTSIHVEHIKSAALNLDLNLLIIGSLDQNIYVYDLKKQLELKFKLSKHLGSIQTILSVSPNMILSGDSNGNVILWSLTLKEWMREFRLPPKESNSSVTTIHYDESTESVYVGYKNGSIRGFDFNTGKQKFQLGSTKDTSAISSICYLKHSDFLIFSNIKGTTRVWNVKKEKETGRFYHLATCILYDEEKDIVISGSDLGEVICWKCLLDEKKEYTFRQIYNTKIHSKRLNSVWYQTNLDMLISTSDDHYISIYENYLKTCFETCSNELKISLELHFSIKENTIQKNFYEKLIAEIKKDNVNNEWNFPKFEKFLKSFEMFKSEIFDESKRNLLEIKKNLIINEMIEQKDRNFYQLNEKRKNLLDKYSKAFVDTKEESIKEIDSEYEREHEKLLKKHQKELEDLKKKYENLKLNFDQEKKIERFKGAEDYYKIEKKFKMKMEALDNNLSKSLKKAIQSIDIIDESQFDFQSSKYKILTKLSKGIYKAIDFKSKKYVIIKQYDDVINVLYFKHSNLIQVNDTILTSKTFIIRDFMKETLLENVDKIGKLNEKEVKNYMLQLLNAVNFLHSNKIVHRNLSLENIFISNENILKIFHIGIMKTLKSNIIESSSNGIVYSSPEFFSFLISFSTDIWSIGLIFIYLLQTPEERKQNPLFVGTTIDEVLFSITDFVPITDPDEFMSLIVNDELKQKFNKVLKKKTTKKFSDVVSNASVNAIELIEKMLKFSPKKRISVQDILKHAYFKEENNDEIKN